VPASSTKYLLLILRLTCTAEILATVYRESIKETNFIIIALILGGLILVWKKPAKWSIAGLYALSAIFFVLACLKFIGSGYQVAQLIELALQVSLPALLGLALAGENKERLYAWFRLAIALTFLGHGWYALGFIYGQPPHFAEMTVNSLGFLGMSDELAPHFLLAAGIMDMLVVIGMFFPKMTKLSAGYAVVWGFLTSAARIAAYVRFGPDFWQLLVRYVPEFLVRVPHFSIPWLVYKDAGTAFQEEIIPLSSFRSESVQP
jgi:hypothetical protein